MFDHFGALCIEVLMGVKFLQIQYFIKYIGILAFIYLINPLMPGGKKKVTHTQINLQLSAQRSAAGLFKYV